MLIRSILFSWLLAALFAVAGFASAQTPGPLVISGNGQAIADGDDSPDVADGTDFGSTTVGSPVEHTFVLENQGDAEIIIESVTVPSGFSVTLAGGGSFPVTLTGSDDVSVHIECLATEATTSNDVVTVVYDPGDVRAGFAINCRVNPGPEIDVAGNSIPIVDGDTTPANDDNTDFGAAPQGTPVTHTFRITNRGEGELTIDGIDVPDGFTVTVSPADAIPSGEQSDFQVRCDAEDDGVYSGNVRIQNNDLDEDPFTFLISCAVDGSSSPEFNPGEDDLPPPESPRPPSNRATPEPTTVPSGGSSGNADSDSSDSPPSSGGQMTGGGASGAVPATATAVRTSTPTAIPSRSSDPQRQSTQSVFRPPSTGSGGLGEESSSLTWWQLTAAVTGMVAIASAVIAIRHNQSDRN